MASYDPETRSTLVHVIQSAPRPDGSVQWKMEHRLSVAGLVLYNNFNLRPKDYWPKPENETDTIFLKQPIEQTFDDLRMSIADFFMKPGGHLSWQVDCPTPRSFVLLCGALYHLAIAVDNLGIVAGSLLYRENKPASIVLFRAGVPVPTT